MKRRRWLVCICLLGLTAGCAKPAAARPAPRSKTVMVSRTGVLYRTQSQVLFFCGTAMANIKTVAALQQYFKAGKTVHIDPHEPTLQAWDLPSPPAFKGRFCQGDDQNPHACAPSDQGQLCDDQDHLGRSRRLTEVDHRSADLAITNEADPYATSKIQAGRRVKPNFGFA